MVLYILQIFGVVDSVLGLVNRLWSRNFRHCDFHGSNILATIEKVDVESSYFDALLYRGRGISPIDLQVR